MEAGPSGTTAAILLILILFYALLTAAETAARTLNKNKLRRQTDMEEGKPDRLIVLAKKLTDTPSGLRACLSFTGFLAAGLSVWGAHRVNGLPVSADILRRWSSIPEGGPPSPLCRV